MTLLDPTAAIVAGLLAGPVLLLWYLLKLRRRPVRVSTTMFWRQAFQDLQVNTPLRWLRASWLLLLHVMGLGLLVVAIGRPALRAEGPPARRVYLLLDRSASMSATDGEGGASRLEEARRRAESIARDLRGIGSRTEVGVVAFAVEPVVLAAPTTSLDAIRRAIGAVTPTDQPADLEGALRVLSAQAAEAAAQGGEEGSPEPPLVVLLSDGALPDAGGSAGGLGEIRLVRVGGAAPIDNLGIVSLSARRDAQDPSRVRLFARLVNAGAEPVAAPVTLSLGGEGLETRAIRVPGGGSEAVVFEVYRPAGGLVTLAIDRGDMLVSDNAAGLALAPASRPRVLLVTPDAGAVDASAPEEPVWLLTDVLTELNPRSLARVGRRQYESMGEAPAADLVVFDRVRPERLPAAPTLSFGAGLPIEGLRGESAEDQAGYVLTWERTHPVLRDVAMDGVFIGEAVRWPEAEKVRGALVLARTARGPVIVLTDDGAVRRLAVGFAPWRSNWPLQAGFPVFVANAIDHLTLRGEVSSGRAFTTAEPVVVAVPEGAGRVTLTGPWSASASAPAGARTASVGVVERSGVYRVEGSEDAALPVNLCDAGESALGLGGQVRVGSRVVEASRGDPVPREIWAWFALAALGVLTLEWLVFARRSMV
ncbi:MAG: VWA domain-containing protein [Phycisphaerae bacterium]|nr:VWA domain-containing protein [Phycisphaerae bacterium]